MIINCMKKRVWEERKNEEVWGKRNIEEDGFIHCSSVDYFDQVAPFFKDTNEELVLICIDENKLTSEVRYEEDDKSVKAYPHVYGLINNDAVIRVIPFLRDEKGDYLRNPELS